MPDEPGGDGPSIRVEVVRRPRWLSRTLFVAASVFLASVLLTAIKARLPRLLLPDPVRFFTEMARLFPYAASMSIEYRVEGYDCKRAQFIELDHRPYFPVRAEDKESRFHRTGFFYRRNRRVLRALDRYLVRRHNARVGREQRIGGILLLSLRVPLPPPGGKTARWRYRSVRKFRVDQRKYWYITSKRRREAICKRVMRGPSR